eukprot:gene44100-53914_t
MRSSLGEHTGNLDRLREQLRDIELQAESQMQSRLAQARDADQSFDPLEFDRFTRVQELTRMMAESVNDVATVQRNLQRAVESTEDSLVAQGRQTRELQRDLLRTRMVEFEGISERLYRVVRQASKETGKQVRLDIEGENTQVDRDVLERLEAPLTHLLRNAVDHGIESPALRAERGKPEEGRILLRARHHAGMLVLELRDDGAGVDLERLRSAVIERGFATVETGARLDEDELLAFLFLPGFSMREQVTEVSGRGVGLDAVQHMVRQLRGGVRMEQRQGEGSSFHLEVPLTLSVVRSLVVEIGGEAYAFPLAHIERMTRVPAEALVQLEGRQHFWHEERHVGLVAASQVLQRPEGESDGDGLAVVLVRERE